MFTLSLQMVACLVGVLSMATASPCTTKAVTGCHKALPYGQSRGAVTNASITSNGLDRNYLVFVPPNYENKKPTQVILSFHGGTKTALQQLELDNLTLPEFNTDSIVVYPQGINNFWQGVPGVTVDDVQFTSDLLDHVSRQYCVDTRRIMVTGKSDGAGFCNVLACDAGLSARIAAFAPVSGAYYVDTLPCDADTVAIPCNNARRDIPLLAFHGGADTVIAYGGGERKKACLPSVPHWIQSWAARENLGASNHTVPYAQDTVIYEFSRGTQKGLVNLVYDRVNGHDWPSTQPNADNQNAGQAPTSFNATPMILDFFAKHTLTDL
ncbi:ferulic acid esterase (FaeA) [Sporothrix brasiliensis 5110]|uniref:feruloyl esterase n=1 Tax=Sporothrix brasiliensis 5110 TaxID=1398154 RepID=A0A0C2IY41_9PEZI|nr:ferulic acid esterase (FaeA) [Sporothrix brasiliensis 5110]KIH89947.1 ferulic acid esterase (FaeA) [Sporothrix brasiliensis 5110]